jgi:NAD(P) transhydrogenase
MSHFDLIVIGGGAAGEKGAVQAAYFGKKVALIEKENQLGGAMVNTGTLPSKTLRETALHLSQFRQRGLHGLDLSLNRKAEVKDLLFRLNEVTRIESARMQHNIERHNVHRVTGTAHFVDAHTVQVGERQYTADFILIATGSAPFRPPEYPFEHLNVYDSDEIVRIHEIPKHMVIVGAGVIGVEYACLFAALGTQVTVVEPKDCMLSFLDSEIVAALTASMNRLGITFLFKSKVTNCIVNESALPVALKLETGECIQTELVLVCAGRQANTANLNLPAAGLSAGKRGQLEVDSHFCTGVKHIAAAGDVIGFPALASTGMDQARVAICHLFDFKYKTNMTPLFPYGIYTIPEISMVGETEETAHTKGIQTVVGRSSFGANSRGAIIGETGFLKLIFNRQSRALIGAHCIGESATEIIHIALVAMQLSGGIDTFIESCFNYPTLSEAYKYAAYDALNQMNTKGTHVESR